MGTVITVTIVRSPCYQILRKYLKNLSLKHWRRKFSLAICYSLKILLLLITRCKVTRYSLRKSHVVKNYSLLVAKFARYCRRSCLFENITCYSFATFTRYSLQQLLVPKHHSLLVCKIRLLLIAEAAHCKDLATRCKTCSLLVANLLLSYSFAKTY